MDKTSDEKDGPEGGGRAEDMSVEVADPREGARDNREGEPEACAALVEVFYSVGYIL